MYINTNAGQYLLGNTTDLLFEILMSRTTSNIVCIKLLQVGQPLQHMLLVQRIVSGGWVTRQIYTGQCASAAIQFCIYVVQFK